MAVERMIQIICGDVSITSTEDFIQRIRQISEEYDVVIQAIDADLLAGRRHAVFAAEKAIRAFEEGKNISKNLGIETLLYIAGTRQIERALRFGIKRGENKVALIVIGLEGGKTNAIGELRELISEDPRVIDYTELKKERIVRAFNITPEEIEAVGEEKIPDLVLERVALTGLTR